MKIAVLIPVYNAEAYLRECLDSVLSEARALRENRVGCELSVFCCDDGSTDGSLSVLMEYAARFGNMHVVSQPNVGVVRARNRLMDELPAEIETFAFLDADDRILPGMYRKLVEALERTEADIAETQWNGPETVLDDMSVFLLRRTAPGRWINVVNKLYRRSATGGLRFREGLRFEEDFFFNFEVHQSIRRKVLVPGDYYYYRHNPASATSALNMQNYYDSASRRIRLSCEEYLLAKRIPDTLEAEFRTELAKDAYRMLIRKNLKKNGNGSERRELFYLAGERIRNLQVHYGLKCDGLNLMQRLLWFCCRHGFYSAARALVCLT